MLRAAGMMSGTSMDGIDIALIETDGVRVGAIGPALMIPYHDNVRNALKAALKAATTGDRQTVMEAERLVTDAHVAVVAEFIRNVGLSPEAIDILGFHGHTVFHAPDKGETWQIGDAARLAQETGLRVAHDFRTADVRAGGEGAPLLPVYHGARAGAVIGAPVAILNIGGVANVTYVAPGGAPDDLLAFDTGPGNALLDDWIHAATGQRMDEDGRIAASGTVCGKTLETLMGHAYFVRPAPKSLDRNAFDPAPVAALSTADGAATLAAFTAASATAAADHFPAPVSAWYLCGGGRHNPSIVNALRDGLKVPVEPVEALGWRGDTLEAEGFAYLAVRTLEGLPLSFPKTTGVRAPQFGGAVVSA